MADSNRPLAIRDHFAKMCGEIALASILTGIVAVVPAAARLTEQVGGSFPSHWIPLAAIAATVALPVVLMLRTTARGIRDVLTAPEDRSVGLLATSIWVAFSALLLATFGALLSSATHHRGLGGTTFAGVGMGLVALSGLVAWRLARVLGRIGRHRAFAWGAFIAVGAAIGALVFAASNAPNASNASVPGPTLAVLDAFLFIVLAIATSRLRLPNAKTRIWVPSAVLLLVALIGAGVATINRVVDAGPRARALVLVASPVLELLAQPDTHPKRLGKSKTSTETTPASKHSAAVPAASSTSARNEPSATTPPSTQPRRISTPDIILITLDTVRADHLGAYGYRRKTSPNLDALAATSTLFERAYAAGPETRTAIAPLVTCKHLVESIRDDRRWPTLLRANQTLAERLRAHGYATGAVTSFQWLSKARGFDQGFDVFDDKARRRVHPERGTTGAHAVAQAMEAYDTLVKTDKPVFLWVHMFDAHKSYQHHDRFDFGNRDMDKYDSEIAYVDDELSRLIRHVKHAQRGAKTVWIVHGSHGEAFGEHGFRGHPPKIFEEVVRVPLFVRLPWAKPHRVKDAVVSVLDVPATVLALAVDSKVEDCSGKSLVGLAEGTRSTLSGRPMLLVAYDGIHGQPPAYGWLNERVKLVLYAWREGEKTRLFDLQADPGEKKDIASERPGQAIKLRKQLDAYLKNELHGVKESPAN